MIPSFSLNPASYSQPESTPVAVVDIGSNSVRLVVYDALSRVPFPIFNENRVCELAGNRDDQGNLAEENIRRTLDTLSRFAAICSMLKPDRVFVIATAAVREAPNGKAFVEAASKVLGCPIQVASGKLEAKLVKRGVETGIWRPDGVAGDLGGGSLELIEVGNKTHWDWQTLPFGTLKMQKAFLESPQTLERTVATTFQKTPLVQQMKGKALYAVGGTWRALGRILFRRASPPFGVLHHFEVERQSMEALIDELTSKPVHKVEGHKAVSVARRAHLPLGATILRALLEVGQPDKIIMSVTGLREGIISQQLTEESFREDPLITCAFGLCAERSRNPAYGLALYPFCWRLVKALASPFDPDIERLLFASALLSECYWRTHPDHRGQQALSELTHILAYGLSYPDRLFLGFCLLARHEGKHPSRLTKPLSAYFNPERQSLALLTGLVLRLAFSLSAATPEILNAIRFETSPNGLTLILPAPYHRLISKVTESRCLAIEKLTGKTVRLKAEELER